MKVPAHLRPTGWCKSPKNERTKLRHGDQVIRENSAGRAGHPGVLDIRGRRDFSRFDPSPPGRPHFRLFNPLVGA